MDWFGLEEEVDDANDPDVFCGLFVATAGACDEAFGREVDCAEVCVPIVAGFPSIEEHPAAVILANELDD